MSRIKSRANANSITIKGFFLLLLFLLTICGGYSGIFLKLIRENSVYRTEKVSVAMFAYVVFISVSVCIVFYIYKHHYLDIPIRKLQKAAKKVTNGDFSVKVSPYRKDGKKDELEILYEDFNRMVKELASIETLKIDFISSVSHEIKTPIAVIENYASYLQSESLTAVERDDYIKTIVEASRRLSGLVNDILSMNKLEHMEILPKGESYSLDNQIRRCMATFIDLYADKEIIFSAELDAVTIYYDESMMELIWNNLISNAVKFTNQGGEISISLQDKDGYITVQVRDNGCGMDKETSYHIFDKFYQGDTSHSKEGNGLGLAMVQKICELYHGKISVESELSKGSTFTVKLKKTSLE